MRGKLITIEQQACQLSCPDNWWSLKFPTKLPLLTFTPSYPTIRYLDSQFLSPTKKKEKEKRQRKYISTRKYKYINIKYPGSWQKLYWWYQNEEKKRMQQRKRLESSSVSRDEKFFFKMLVVRSRGWIAKNFYQAKILEEEEVWAEKRPSSFLL